MNQHDHDELGWVWMQSSRLLPLFVGRAVLGPPPRISCTCVGCDCSTVQLNTVEFAHCWLGLTWKRICQPQVATLFASFASNNLLYLFLHCRYSLSFIEFWPSIVSIRQLSEANNSCGPPRWSSLEALRKVCPNWSKWNTHQ